MGVAFIDLDRTLLKGASGPAISRALTNEGVLSERHQLAGQGLLYGAFDRFGESLLSMGLARGAAFVAKGWSQEKVRCAAKAAVPELLELVSPYAPARLAQLRAEGHRIVLATTTPRDYVEPLAEALGLDDVLATRYETVGDRYTGRLFDGFVWGPGKLAAVRRWLAQDGTDLSECLAFSDSIFDVPLLSSVGSPHAVNADLRLLALAKVRGWSCEQWDRPDGVPGLFGLEPYDLLAPLVRPEAFPYARFDITGVENIPAQGPVLLAANHRSYFDVAALALVAARLHRPVRAMAKAELFDAPLLSVAARSLGAIRVERDGDAAGARDQAEAALRAGEVVLILPQGTIPRGEAFFDPVLHAKSGAARLAQATGAPVVPIGLWGTEQVWPRSARLPRVGTLLDPPRVSVVVGEPMTVPSGDPAEGTRSIMAAIASLLPPESRHRRIASAEELRATHPAGHLDVEVPER